MRIAFKCPACGVTGKAPESYAGKSVDCPECSAPIPIPLAPPAPTGTTSHAPRPAGATLRNTILLLSVCGIAWGVTLHAAPYTASTKIHYGSIIVASAVIGFALTKRIGAQWLFWASVSVGLVAACVWYRFDVYCTSWTHVEHDDELESSYEDWIYRASGEHSYRKHWMTKRGEFLREYSAEGPFVGTGKQHGHWTSFTWEGRKLEHLWYWYGEKITEGEWHLRNR